jgi:hypothetical protein
LDFGFWILDFVGERNSLVTKGGMRQITGHRRKFELADTQKVHWVCRKDLLGLRQKSTGFAENLS